MAGPHRRGGGNNVIDGCTEDRCLGQLAQFAGPLVGQHAAKAEPETQLDILARLLQAAIEGMRRATGHADSFQRRQYRIVRLAHMQYDRQPDGALLPLPMLILAWIGVMRLDLAFTVDRWILVVALPFYGFIASKLNTANSLLD